jgi:acylphosphatase
MSRERRRIYYSGRVQGVGFRFSTQRLASGFAVAGSVKNLRDGRVEVVAEGEPTELDLFQEAIRGEMGHYIRAIQIETESLSDPSQEGFIVGY